MSININPIKGKPRAIGNRVLVSDMHFGEQKTNSGIILKSDDGKAHGIYSRWGKVYSKGPKNTDPYNVGDWILVEHGRWTRSFDMELSDDNIVTVRMIEAESILAWSDEKPSGVQLGNEYSDGQGVDIDPSLFTNQ
jgi:hypothetical protein